MSKKYEREWASVIKSSKTSTLEKYILLYLKKSTRNKRMVDLPCWINYFQIIISQ